MAKIILCLANEISDDPHINAIEKHVKALDSEARVVRLDPVSDSNFIEVNIANTSKKTPPSCFVIVDGERISAESITSVWYGWNPVGQRADTLQGRFLGINARDIYTHPFRIDPISRLSTNLHITICQSFSVGVALVQRKSA